jgi:hypothetical protein
MSTPRRGPRGSVGALIEEVRFARDSPVEGDGFEPSVPRQKDCEKAKESISHKRQVRKGRTGQSPQSMEVSIWNSLPKGAPF